MSYLDYFKLHSQPFSEHASREALWNDARMQEGLSRLNYLQSNGLVGLVLGASGLGKSALIRRFMQDCSPQVCEPIYCHLAHLPAHGLLKLTLSQLGEVPRRGKERLYSQLLDRARRSAATLMLIFDEAHLLSGDALVDLRLLVSSAVEAGPPLKILLCGQEPLRHTLKRTEYVDIVNRISVRHQLRPLSKDQTRGYIDFQLARSGGDAKLFDESVKGLIHEFTGGNPRSINNVSTACLLAALSRRTPRIDEDVFRQASSELQWN
jgi:general secretion pathway protein A